MDIQITGTAHEVQQLQNMVNRMLNTLEPEKWPEWLQAMDQALGYLGTMTQAHVGHSRHSGHHINVTRVTLPT